MATNYRIIHVAGTNGKGSVATKIAHGLTAAGYRTGLYTSPHLLNFEERIAIDGIAISKERVHAEFKHDQSTLFASTTLFALDYFNREKVDFAVIEVGIGGRKDPTNIVQPILSVITSISLDHTALLGNTLEEIARDKAGIIKPGIPVVVGPHANLAPICECATNLHSPLHLVGPVPGYFEQENCAIAKRALQLLQVPEYAIEIGLKSRPPCRFEERRGVIFDVAHNPSGFARLLEALELHYPDKKWRFCIGMSQDKDMRHCLRILAPHSEHFYFVSANMERSTKAEQLAEILNDLGDYPYSLGGFKQALGDTCPNEKLVVCGSFFIIPEILEQLTELRPHA